MQNSRVVTLTDGQKAEISNDPNQRSPDEIFRKLRPYDYNKVMANRNQATNNFSGNKRDVSQVSRDDQSVPSRIDTGNDNNRSIQVSETNRSLDGFTIMVGRSEQAALRNAKIE